MNAPKSIHKTGKLTSPFLRTCCVRLHERLAAWFLLPQHAEKTAPQSAVDWTQSPSVGRRSRPGRTSLCSLLGLPTDAGRGLRPVLPGLLALLVAAGLSAEVEAQTPTFPSISPTEIYEGETLEFTVSVNLNYGGQAWIDYNYIEPADSGGTATEGTSNDWYFANSSGTRVATINEVVGISTRRLVTLGDGSQYYEIDFRLHANTDSAAEGDETIRLHLEDFYSNHDNDYLTITLKDGSRPAVATDGVTLSGSALTLTELGSSSDVEKTYTVVLDTDPGANVVVTVASNDSSAVAVDTDSSTAGDQDTLTFTTSNWNAAQTVTLRAVNDGDAAAETVTISHTAAVTDTSNPYNGIEIDDVTATTVDAGHGVVVSKANVSVTADSDTETYTIKLKSQPGGSVVITPTSSATARATVSGALTFTTGNWSTPQTVTVTGAGAGSATISHRVSTAATGYPTSTTIASVTATVTAPAAVPELTFASATYSVTEDDHPNTVTLTVTVNASVAPTSDLTVNLSSAAGTATVNDDYTAPASTFTFTGGNTTETIDVVIGFDDFYEVDETFTLTLNGGTGYTVGTPATTTVTIIDEDNVGVRLSAATATVGEGDGNYTVTVSLIGKIETPVDVTLTMDDGTATGGSGGTGTGVDYNNDTLTPVRIAAHDSSVTRTIRINDDNIFEGPETFTVTLSVVAGQPRVSGVAFLVETTVTITDNDTAPPNVTMSASDGDADGNAVEGASNTTGYRTITLTLGRALTGSETMTVPLTVVGATVTDDYTFGLEPGTQTGVALTTSGGTYTAQNPAVVFTSGGQTATLRLTPVDNNSRTQPYVVVDVGTPISNRGTVSAPTGGPIGIVLVDDETGDIEVPSSWGLAPSGLSGGADFRLLFRTSTGRNATSSDIEDYDAFVRSVLAGGGHADIKPYAGFFKVFGGTRSTSGATGTSARVHNGMATAHTGHLQSGPWTDGSTRATVGNAAGVPTYWLNGEILANNYADLCDINWSGGSGVTTGWGTDDPRSEDGMRNIPTGSISDYGPYETWTGSGNACEAFDHPLGAGTVSRSSADSGGGQTLLHSSAATNTGTHPLYGYSPVFTVAAAPAGPEISVSLPSAEGVSPIDGKKPREESVGSAVFNLSANQPLPSALTVCVRVTESGGDRVASGDEGIKTVSLTSSGMTNGSGTHTLTWTNTAADDPDSSVTVEVLAPNTASCSATNGSYTVSSSEGSDKLLIQDDEDTTVELTSTDVTMTEGDASDTATLTVELSRQLYAGETIGVPIALASTTGARLPGSTNSGTANHDFTVAASGTEVTLENALTANPRVVFTGHDTNTVQTATVTLAPVASRDDGDAIDETITATLASLGLVDTTVSGGVTAHATNNAATLTLEDDEAPPPPPAACSAQDNNLSVSSVRVLENGGMATYCVRLPTAPSGGNTTVTIGTTGRYTGAATASTTTLTFTASNYMNPQPVTVTGVDQPNLHLNRTLSLTHAANGGGYSNQGLGWVSVTVDDAPELEAWDTAVWTGSNRSPSQRPSTITTSNGFSHFRQDFSPGPSGLYYKLRLSNRPATGGTVTVMATSSDSARFRLALTPDGTPQPSLTVTFEDRDADPGCHNSGRDDIFVNEDGTLTPANGRVGDDRDNSPDTAWRCYRRIWVINMQALPAPSKGCSTISHTASGGGLRATYVGSIRAHTISNNGRSCPRITGTPEAGDNKNYNPQGSPAEAPPAPTEAVANVQVTAVDDASATVTWDAVEHATSYDVSWSAESSDSLNASAGSLPGLTGTTATIQHDASVAMTLTVTVTPEYVDKNGDTQQLDTLAATATLDVGPQPLSGGGTNDGGNGGGVDASEGDAQASATAACVSADLMQHVEARIAVATTDRWERIRNALIGQPNAITLSEVKEIHDNRKANGLPLNRFDEVIAAMECIETAMQQQPVPDETPDANPDSGPDAVPDPVPDPDTDSDPTPEPDPVPDPVACVSPQLRSDVEGYSKETWQGSAHVERWLRVLQTFSGTANDTTVMTPTEAEGYVNRGWQRWVPVLEALKCMEQQALDSN